MAILIAVALPQIRVVIDLILADQIWTDIKCTTRIFSSVCVWTVAWSSAEEPMQREVGWEGIAVRQRLHGAEMKMEKKKSEFQLTLDGVNQGSCIKSTAS